jgi:MFS family permease
MLAVRNTVQIDAPIVRNATRCGFFMAGFGLSVWAPLVPYVRERIEMTDAVFGLLLLCIGVGSLTWMPLSGVLVSRWGIRPVQLCSVVLLALALAGMALTDSMLLLALALFCFGGSLGVIDVIMNIQAVLVETAVGRRLMSNFHGMYSLGAISGALMLTGLLTLGLAPEIGSFLMIGLIVGLMCFVVYLAEGAVLDWSALYLTGEKGLEVAKGGLGYAAFALMVTIARFAGGPLVNALGTARVIAFGGLLAAFGIGLSLAAEHWAVALIGYGLCGLGCANVSPVLISSLSRQDGMPVQLAVTVATTIGFAGVLAGPAMMGVVAHFSSLGMAFALLAVLLVGIVPFCRRFTA